MQGTRPVAVAGRERTPTSGRRPQRCRPPAPAAAIQQPTSSCSAALWQPKALPPLLPACRGFSARAEPRQQELEARHCCCPSTERRLQSPRPRGQPTACKACKGLWWGRTMMSQRGQWRRRASASLYMAASSSSMLGMCCRSHSRGQSPKGSPGHPTPPCRHSPRASLAADSSWRVGVCEERLPASYNASLAGRFPCHWHAHAVMAY